MSTTWFCHQNEPPSINPAVNVPVTFAVAAVNVPVTLDVAAVRIPVIFPFLAVNSSNTKSSATNQSPPTNTSLNVVTIPVNDETPAIFS